MIAPGTLLTAGDGCSVIIALSRAPAHGSDTHLVEVPIGGHCLVIAKCLTGDPSRPWLYLLAPTGQLGWRRENPFNVELKP